MQKPLIIILSLIFIVSATFSPLAHAEEISEDKAGLISMTCGSIKLQLKKLQKTDSLLRVNLGSDYETILNNYITNLNLRLVKNNRASSDLTSLQTTFSSERERFKSDFTTYAKSLDELIDLDCKNNPYDFYKKLESTRILRSDVRASYLRLKDILSWHRSAVFTLKESL